MTRATSVLPRVAVWTDTVSLSPQPLSRTRFGVRRPAGTTQVTLRLRALDGRSVAWTAQVPSDAD